MMIAGAMHQLPTGHPKQTSRHHYITICMQLLYGFMERITLFLRGSNDDDRLSHLPAAYYTIQYRPHEANITPPLHHHMQPWYAHKRQFSSIHHKLSSQLDNNT